MTQIIERPAMNGDDAETAIGAVGPFVGSAGFLVQDRRAAISAGPGNRNEKFIAHSRRAHPGHGDGAQ